MKAELLTSVDKQSFFIHCRLKGELLEVGAVYIAPLSSSPMTLLTEEGGKLSLTLPLDAVNQPTEMVAVEMSFLVD